MLKKSDRQRSLNYVLVYLLMLRARLIHLKSREMMNSTNYKPTADRHFKITSPNSRIEITEKDGIFFDTHALMLLPLYHPKSQN